MKIVYLDQNKWIELSRMYYGRCADPSSILTLLLKSREMELAHFPLSLGHYMETHKHHNPDARSRLANFMLMLSGGYSLIDVTHVVRFELDNALFRLFPYRVRADRIGPLNLMGWGVFHAAGDGSRGLTLTGPSVDEIPVTARRKMEFTATALREHALLSGVMPFTREEAPRPPRSDHARNFMNHLDRLTREVRPLNPDLRERTLYAVSMADILEPLNAAFERHSIGREEFEALGMEGFYSFLEDMPTRKVDIHLHRQWAKNPSLKPKESDLNDWAFLGFASMYCDIVVTERQFADLLQRDGFRPKARVITQLAELAPLLLSS